jgi:hypothetical protein
MRCPDHLTIYPPAAGCPWCRLEAEATDQHAGAERVRAAMRVPARSTDRTEVVLDRAMLDRLTEIRDQLPDPTPMLPLEDP